VGVLKDSAQSRLGERARYAEIDTHAARAALIVDADVILVIDHQGHVLSTAGDPDLVASLGLADGRDVRETLVRDSLGKLQELLDEAAAGPRRPRELTHLTARGGAVSIHYRAMPQGGHGDMLLVGRDLRHVAELQQRLVKAQQATERDLGRIRAMETRYRVLFQLSSEPMLICDAATRRVAEANAACLTAFNLPLGRLVGRSLPSLFDEHDADVLGGLITNAMSGREAPAATLRAAIGETRFSTTVSLFRQDGASHFLVRATPAAVGSGPFAANDATFLHALLERLPEAFLVTDNEGRVIEANRRFLDLAELPSLAAAEGKGLDHWLGRPGIDFGVLLASLKDSGAVRGFATVLRGAYGANEAVEVTAVALFDHAEPRLGFLLRTERSHPAVDHAGGAPMPRSLEQMKQLVGAVPMKELVRETSDMIERLCIEAALEMTGDNRASAADMLGLSRQSLYAKLHRFGIGDLSGEPEASARGDNT
jgi:transcriptional regulator PpsR